MSNEPAEAFAIAGAAWASRVASDQGSLTVENFWWPLGQRLGFRSFHGFLAQPLAHPLHVMGRRFIINPACTVHQLLERHRDEPLEELLQVIARTVPDEQVHRATMLLTREAIPSS